jgi:hypothetical protein
VYIFITGHPKAKRCYAWKFIDDKNQEQVTTVLEIPPVESAKTAGQASIIAQHYPIDHYERSVFPPINKFEQMD